VQIRTRPRVASTIEPNGIWVGTRIGVNLLAPGRRKSTVPLTGEQVALLRKSGGGN